MKTNPLFLRSVLLSTCLSITGAFAQLSGTTTISNLGSSANYQSFSAFATALNTQGVSGSLVVNVAAGSGPYVELPVFKEAPGVSAVNRITINGNNTLLTFTNNPSANAAWTLLLKGSDYMYFNDLNIKAIGNFHHAVACHLCEGADYNHFSRCTFSCVANNSTFEEIPVAISSASNSATAPSTNKAGSFNSFDHCVVFSGAYAVYLSGDPNAAKYADANSNVPNNHGNVFSNCHMTDFSYYGVYAEYQENLSITDCHVDRPPRPQFAVGYGIGVYRDRGGLSCLRNCIDNMAGGFANTQNSAHINGI